MSGPVVAVVGPSGVGKDSVMAGICAAAPGITLVRRAITRAPGLGGEDYAALSPAEFAAQVAADAFCLHWQAHGLSYGIPHAARQAPNTQLINLSRKVLGQAARVFDDFLIINLTARPETLAARVAARGRESADEVAARLTRQVPAMAPDLPVHQLSNDGPLDDTVAAALALIQPLRA